MTTPNPLHVRLTEVVHTIERDFGAMLVFAYASWAANRGYMPPRDPGAPGLGGEDVAGVLARLDQGAAKLGRLRAFWRRLVLLVAARALLRRLRNAQRMAS